MPITASVRPAPPSDISQEPDPLGSGCHAQNFTTQNTAAQPSLIFRECHMRHSRERKPLLIPAGPTLSGRHLRDSASQLRDRAPGGPRFRRIQPRQLLWRRTLAFVHRARGHEHTCSARRIPHEFDNPPRCQEDVVEIVLTARASPSRASTNSDQRECLHAQACAGHVETPPTARLRRASSPQPEFSSSHSQRPGEVRSLN